MHGQLNLKPFTVSFLNPLARWEVRRGERFYWRVTGLTAEILDAAFSVPVGYELQAGALILTVEDVQTRVEDIIAGVREMSAAIDKKLLHELSAQIRLTEWAGQSKKFYLSRDRGTLGFYPMGLFKFWRQIFSSLAR